jgi:hypothetical protein
MPKAKTRAMGRNSYRRQQISQRAKSIREQRASGALTRSEEKLVESWVDVYEKAKKPPALPQGKKLSKKQVLIKARQGKKHKAHKKLKAQVKRDLTKGQKAYMKQRGPPTPKNQYIRSHKFTREAALAHLRFGGKKKIFTTAISYRYAADLLDPQRGFTDDREAHSHGSRSTAIISFTYIDERRFLMLHWWKDWKQGIPGPTYGYFNVPWETYEELVRASSKGRYIYYNIRGAAPAGNPTGVANPPFPYVKISDGGGKSIKIFKRKPPKKYTPLRDPAGEMFRRIQQGY